MRLIKPHKLLEPGIGIDELIPRISEEPAALPECESDSAYMDWLNNLMRKTDMVQNNTEFIGSARYELADI